MLSFIYVAQDNDGKSLFARYVKINRVFLRRKVVLRAAQCTSLTFMSVKERCTLVGRVLLLKQSPRGQDVMGFSTRRTIVFNYVLFRHDFLFLPLRVLFFSVYTYTMGTKV